MPDFIIIGAAKSGTTSLAQYLGQHPQVHMSRLKEARFLAYPEGPPAYRGYGPNGGRIMSVYHDTLPGSQAAYEALFDGASPDQLTGEASPAYIYLPAAAENIRNLYPDAKLIAILRNPVQRAYSSYLHMLREDAEELSFAEALAAEQGRISEGAGLPYHYASMGFYARQLAGFSGWFDRKCIAIFYYEDFVRDTAATLVSICGFLDIDPGFSFDTLQKRNVSGVPVNRGLFNAFNRFKRSLLPASVKRVLPAGLRTRLNQAANERLLRKPGIGEQEARQLAALYREDSRQLANLVGSTPPWNLE
jgi:hypothetical protein